MRLIRWTLPLLATLALYPLDGGTGIEGNWEVRYVSGLATKTIGDAEFTFNVNGSALTGTANVGLGWPGKARISDGTIDGERISFTVQGENWSSTGYPGMLFTGTIHGDQLKLSMVFYPDTYAATPWGETEFEGGRVTAR